VNAAVPLALALATAGPGAHGRLVVSAGVGSGVASDPYLGAGAGPGSFAQLAPGARLDLSVSRRVKLAATAEASLAGFGVGAAAPWAPLRAGSSGDESAFAVDTEAVELEARLLGTAVDGVVAVAGERAAFSSAAPENGLVGRPGVTGSAAALLTPEVRFRRGRTLLRAGTTVSYRQSRTADGTVPERGLAATGGATFRAHRAVLVEGAVRHERIASDRPDFTLIAWGGSGTVALTPSGEDGLEVRLRGDLEQARLDTGTHETLTRAALDVAHPVGPVTAVATWTYARSSESAAGNERHVFSLGIRVRTRVLEW
jgi:hypothetical protein